VCDLVTSSFGWEYLVSSAFLVTLGPSSPSLPSSLPPSLPPSPPDHVHPVHDLRRPLPLPRPCRGPIWSSSRDCDPGTPGARGRALVPG
jgi:hypothetical protein